MRGHSEEILIHDTTIPCELWNRIISHINYKSLPHVSKVVTGLHDLNIYHEQVCKGCAKGKNINNPFPKINTNT